MKGNVLVMHRDEVQATILAVDTAHKFADLSFEFWRVGKSRGCNLNKDDPTYPLRVIVQQLRERAQLLYNPLDNVQLIASNDDLFPGVELEEGLQLGLNARTRAKNEIVSKRTRKPRTLYDSQVTRDARRVDTDGSMHDGSDMALHVDTARSHLISTDSHTG
jgi:hypothetical protein